MRRIVGLFSLVVCLLAPLSAGADSEDRRINVVNESDLTVTRLYGSNIQQGSWQEDILGSDVIPVGSSVVIDFDDGTGHCLFDVKAVLSDGTSRFKRSFNVCRNTTLIVR